MNQQRINMLASVKVIPSFKHALAKVMGCTNGDKARQFDVEYARLSDDDKQFFYDEMRKLGIECSAP